MEWILIEIAVISILVLGIAALGGGLYFLIRGTQKYLWFYLSIGLIGFLIVFFWVLMVGSVLQVF